jgi:BirA family biotin operon repressor/biotin-[acetyl-CoA-carboxylase] ligase
MVVYTDSVDYARLIVGDASDPWSAPAAPSSSGIRRLLEHVYDGREVRESRLQINSAWNCLLLVESAQRSNYDLLIELGREDTELPDRCLLLAGAGRDFHGFKGRAWVAPPGNIYLSVYLMPERAIPNPACSFTVLAAVSVVDAMDSLPGLEGRAGIKWVNDVLIDGAKVGGVLAYTQTVGHRVTGAVLGIGVNVETVPEVEPTLFVPRVSSLLARSQRPELCTQRSYLSRLLVALEGNYRLLTGGGYESLLDRYRQRSLVIGREVTLCPETSESQPDTIATGRVTGLGDDLGLTIEGHERPFTKGRLMMGSVAELVSRKR